MLRKIIPCFLCLLFIFSGFGITGNANDSLRAAGGQDRYFYRTAVNDDGIQVIAKRPFIKRGEIGVIALKCAPRSGCKIICNYKINGKSYNVTRNLVAGKDGSILCTWKVDKNTDPGTYDIEVTCGQSRFVTNYIVK